MTTSESFVKPMPGWLVLLFAATCGFAAANLYYAQPIISIISNSLGQDASTASFIVTLGQLGYCAGLFFLVPLGDLLDNRRLILCTMGVLIVALAASALAPTSELFLLAMFILGGSSVVAQMIVPVAAHLSSDANRGQVVGTVMSGLLTGILLSRPVSILITDSIGWRSVFGISAVLIAVIMIMLARLLPARRPTAGHSYAELIGSLLILWRTTPLVRLRAFYQASLFASFILFWTIVPLHLAGPSINLQQSSIALFALVGALGVLAAPVAGRFADRGKSHIATGFSISMVAFAFLLAIVWPDSLFALVCASVLLDIGVQANLVIGQRAIYSLGADKRSRLNALYVAFFFVGGALGSALASPLFEYGQWKLVCGVGLAFPVTALFLYARNNSKY